MVTWLTVPKTQLKVDFNVKLSHLTREDSLVMSIEDITAIEESFFSIE